MPASFGRVQVMAKAGSGEFKDWEALHQQWWNAVSEGAGRFVHGDWREGAKAFGDLLAESSATVPMPRPNASSAAPSSIWTGSRSSPASSPMAPACRRTRAPGPRLFAGRARSDGRNPQPAA